MEQGTDEWFAARAGKITASRIGDVMAKGAGKTRAKYLGQIVAERMTGEPSRMAFKSSSMEWGNETEGQARADYTLETFAPVQQVGIIFHPEYPNFAASPDGLIGDDGGLEIKCPDTHTHLDTLLKGNAPATYIKQIQWNMFCTGRKWWDFMSFEPTLPDHLRRLIVRVDRDDDLIEEMEKEAIAFDEDANAMIADLNKKYPADL